MLEDAANKENEPTPSIQNIRSRLKNKKALKPAEKVDPTALRRRLEQQEADLDQLDVPVSEKQVRKCKLYAQATSELASAGGFDYTSIWIRYAKLKE